MKNFVQEGNALDLVAPAGGVTAGKPVKIGDLIVVPSTDAAEGETFAGWTEGVYEVDTDTGASWAQGEKVYLLADGSAFTKTATSNTKAGVTIAAKASGATRSSVRLIPTI